MALKFVKTCVTVSINWFFTLSLNQQFIFHLLHKAWYHVSLSSLKQQIFGSNKLHVNEIYFREIFCTLIVCRCGKKYICTGKSMCRDKLSAYTMFTLSIDFTWNDATNIAHWIYSIMSISSAMQVHFGIV